MDWKPPAEEPDEEYPFVFTTGRVLYHYHTGSMTRRSAGLEAIYSEAVVELNTHDAARLAIADGAPGHGSPLAGVRSRPRPR